MARFLFLCATFFWLLGDAVADCKPTASEQDCSYMLTWNWEQGEGAPADSFQVQQEVDQNGTTSAQLCPSVKELSPIRFAETKAVAIFAGACWPATPGGAAIASNVVCVVTPPIEATNSVAITTRPGLLVNLSRRAPDTTSIVAVLINKDEALGPAASAT